MKKILAAILAVAMVMSFAACGDSSSKSDSSSKASSSSAAESSSAADSSAADSSAADSSAADSSAAESTADSSEADTSAIVGAWTVAGGKKADGADISLDEIAEANGTTADAYKATIVFNADGTTVSYSGGKSEQGTYTIEGTTINAKDSKGENQALTIDGDSITAKIDENYLMVFKKDDSFTPPADTEQQGGEEQPAEQQGEEQPAEQQAEEPAAE